MFSRKKVVFLLFSLILILSIISIIPRFKSEQNNKTVSFAVDYNEVNSLAMENDVNFDIYWRQLHANGVNALAVAELTGEELLHFNPLNIEYGMAKKFKLDEIAEIPPLKAVFSLGNVKPELAKMVEDYLKLKINRVKIIEVGNVKYVVLPDTVASYYRDGLIPNFNLLTFCSDHNITVIYRPGYNHSISGSSMASALAYIFDRYKNVKMFLPSGSIIPGYPDLNPVISVLNAHSVAFAQVEFVKQVGEGKLMYSMVGNILPLHSLTRDEIISRRITPLQVKERYLRAIKERSIRVALLHPYGVYFGNRSGRFLEGLSEMKHSIENKGYTIGWPTPIKNRKSNLPGALALALAFFTSLTIYTSRCFGHEDNEVSLQNIFAIIFIVITIAALLLKIPAIAKVLGGFTGALIATSAALIALDSSDNRCLGAIKGLIILITGGLAIASFYGTSMAALRLTPFSGVKLTLLLPPLLILGHDFKRGIHPEPLQHILERPALWLELILLGGVVLAMGVVALRSGNVASVPSFEVHFREFMERVMSLRPRTKEFVIGYPMLVLYWYLVRHNIFAEYREVVRLGAVLAFCSAINTFCHFHTEILLSVLRVFNGWWLGLMIGTIGVCVLKYIFTPLYHVVRK